MHLLLMALLGGDVSECSSPECPTTAADCGKKEAVCQLAEHVCRQKKAECGGDQMSHTAVISLHQGIANLGERLPKACGAGVLKGKDGSFTALFGASKASHCPICGGTVL